MVIFGIFLLIMTTLLRLNFKEIPFEIPLITCEINLILTWPARSFVIDAPFAGQELTFIDPSFQGVNTLSFII